MGTREQSDRSRYLRIRGGFGSNVRSSTTESVTDARNSAIERAKELRDGITSLVTQLPDRAKGWGRDLINSLRDGVNDRLSSVVSAFTNLGDAAASALGNTFTDLVPSSISIPSRSVSIPDVLGGGSVSIGGGRLIYPQLAEGGIISRPTIATIGEGNQSEAVIQLDKLNAMLSGNREGGQQINITIEEGAIQIRSNGNGEIDEHRLVRRLRDELGRGFGRRT